MIALILLQVTCGGACTRTHGEAFGFRQTASYIAYNCVEQCPDFIVNKCYSYMERFLYDPRIVIRVGKCCCTDNVCNGAAGRTPITIVSLVLMIIGSVLLANV